MNFGNVSVPSPATNSKGPKKTIRPVTHNYIRLVADIDPSAIPKDPPVKSEVVDVDGFSPQPPTQPEDSWIAQQKWYKKRWCWL